jgi:Putative zinc-finger
MTQKCIDTPVSWLRLERYHLGELPPEERTKILAHVTACPACAACLKEVDDGAKKTLPTLTSPPSKQTNVIRIIPFIVTGLALAAAAILWIGPFSKVETNGPVASSDRVKGGDVAFTLARDDDELIGDAAGTYHDGDRFKALVTCPAGLDASWDLVVFERGEASFPLASASHLPCGNAVPLEGAFRLTGAESMTVCVVWGDPLDRAKVTRDGEHGLGEHALCKLLQPVR